jgi:NAD(P)-dependent dehydrogenase (short-subunit alcohol dehydrogenase family)
VARENLADKRIWIIGASHGIGEQLAHELARAGASIIASGRSKHKLKELCTTLTGSDHLPLPLDVQNERALRDALRTLTNHYGVLDMVIYMAGVYSPAHAWDFKLNEARETININLTGIFTMLHVVVPEFIRQHHGSIVLTGSVVGYRGLPGSLAYGASKAAISNLAETLHADLSERNIRVQLISPGFVETRMTDRNPFAMPCMISAEKAAIAIRKGLERNAFEIHFPKRFTYPMKLLRILPTALYLKLIRRQF